MRIYKFRIWDSLVKKMYYRGYSIGDNGAPYITSKEWREDRLNAGWKIYDNEGKLTAQQFTGLTDKNDKEIYEGDILSFSRKNALGYMPSFKKEAIFKHGAFCMKRVDEDFDWDKDFRMAGNLLGKGNPWVVIGNIFENPELLKTT